MRVDECDRLDDVVYANLLHNMWQRSIAVVFIMNREESFVKKMCSLCADEEKMSLLLHQTAK